MFENILKILEKGVDNYNLIGYYGIIRNRKNLEAEKEKNMKVFKIMAANKKHFNSLIKDFRNDGFMLITLGDTLAELEKGNEFVVIEF